MISNFNSFRGQKNGTTHIEKTNGQAVSGRGIIAVWSLLWGRQPDLSLASGSAGRQSLGRCGSRLFSNRGRLAAAVGPGRCGNAG